MLPDLTRAELVGDLLLNNKDFGGPPPYYLGSRIGDFWDPVRDYLGTIPY